MIRLLTAVRLLPLVKAVRRYQAAAFFEGFAEGGLLGGRLRVCVYHAGADTGVVGPGRDQTPPQQLQSSFPSTVRHDDGHFLARRHVVARWQVRQRPGDIELSGQLLDRRRKRVPAAHTKTSRDRSRYETSLGNCTRRIVPFHPRGSRPEKESFRQRSETQKERRCKKRTKMRRCLQSIRSNEERRRIRECR